MYTTIINNAKTAIQTYITCSTSTNTITQTDLQQLATDMLTTVGSNNNSDLQVSCAESNDTNLNIGVWNAVSTQGQADSWAVYDMTTGNITNSHTSNYSIAVTGDKTGGYVITIGDSTGPSTEEIPTPTPEELVPKKGFQTFAIIIIIILVLLLVGGIGLVIFFVLRKKDSRKAAADPFAQTGAPFFIG